MYTLFNNRRKGTTFKTTLICMNIMLGLALGALTFYQNTHNASRMAQMQMELDQIKLAVVSYELSSATGAPPDNLKDVLNVAGLLDKKHITTDGENIYDPWGHPYRYDADTRVITCVPQDSSGNPLPEKQMRF